MANHDPRSDESNLPIVLLVGIPVLLVVAIIVLVIGWRSEVVQWIGIGP